MRTLAGFLIAVCLSGMTPAIAAAAQAAERGVLKVPCRDMGDGRTLLDSAYLPDNAKNARYTIIATAAASMSGEWANRICTIRLRR